MLSVRYALPSVNIFCPPTTSYSQNLDLFRVWGSAVPCSSHILSFTHTSCRNDPSSVAYAVQAIASHSRLLQRKELIRVYKVTPKRKQLRVITKCVRKHFINLR